MNLPKLKISYQVTFDDDGHEEFGEHVQKPITPFSVVFIMIVTLFVGFGASALHIAVGTVGSLVGIDDPKPGSIHHVKEWFLDVTGMEERSGVPLLFFIYMPLGGVLITAIYLLLDRFASAELRRDMVAGGMSQAKMAMAQGKHMTWKVVVMRFILSVEEKFGEQNFRVLSDFMF